MVVAVDYQVEVFDTWGRRVAVFDQAPLLEAVTFLDYVRLGTQAEDTDSQPPGTERAPQGVPSSQAGPRPEASPTDMTSAGGGEDETPPPPRLVTGGAIRTIATAALETAQLERLRKALCQLADGLLFLHQAVRGELILLI